MEPTVWTADGKRVWWACPVCKVEAGITLPVPLSQIVQRMNAFRSQHEQCADKAQGGKAWRV